MIQQVYLRLIPDHSLLKWSINFSSLMSSTLPESDTDLGTQFVKFDCNNLPSDFMTSDKIYSEISTLIEKLQTYDQGKNCVNDIYTEFCKTVELEMSDKLPSKTVVMGCNKSKKKYRNRKPWWNEGLNKLWSDMCKAEKAWNKCNKHKRELKTIYVQKRKCFDREVQKSKRKYWYEMQEQLLSESASNQSLFWKKIGKIGIAENRKSSIPMEVIGSDGNISSDLTDVLNRWKSDYSNLLNQQNCSIGVSYSCSRMNEESTFNDFFC